MDSTIMKLFVLLSMIAVSIAQQSDNYLSIECPIPDSGAPPDETECAKYSACEWDTDGGICHMGLNNYAGYIVASDPVDTGRGVKVSVTKANNSATLFGGDIQDLTVEVIYHEDDHLQVKITDPANARYEVPILLTLPSVSGTDPIYDVTFNDVGKPFTMTVTRKSTNTVVFGSVGPLTYEDQFIQISTRLASSYLYGIGENPHSTLRHKFDERTTWALFARDQPVVTTNVNQYGSHPYYVNVEDDEGNTHSVLFFNSNAMEYSTFKLADGDAAITMRTIGGIIDLHFFLGPTPEDIQISYLRTIGKPELPPYWTLGFQLSRYGYGSTANYTIVRDRMRALGIPQDVQVFDIDYMNSYRDFTYDSTNWGDFPQVIDNLHAENIKVILILDPAIAIDTSYSTFANGKANDVFIKWDNASLVPADQPADAADYVVGYVWPDDKTVFPDFFKPETIEWWTNELTTLHDQLAFDGIWIDMNEPANFGTNLGRPWNYPSSEPDWSLKCPDNAKDNPPYPTSATTMNENESNRLSDKTICMSSLQTNGTSSFSHYDVHNLYGYSETFATEKALKTVFGEDHRPAILSRSTFPGSGARATHWLGDNTANWDQLRTSIIGMIEFNLFGIPMVGADVCGFFGAPSEQLCIRWMQLGAFYPFDRNHNFLGEPDQDPARPDWTEGNTIMRNVLLFRYKLLPYFYSRLHGAHMNGYSLIRPMFASFPSDLVARDIDDQFMWYEDIMVAPVVTEDAVDRDVYFPSSLWYDIESGVLVSEGIETLNVPAPINVIPVYLRGGAIVPTQTPEVTTTLSIENNYSLSVALNETLGATGELYMDDTVLVMSMPRTYLASIQFNVTELTMTQKHNETVLEGKFLEYVEFFGFPSAPNSMTLNTDTVDSSSWTYGSATKVLKLNLTHDMTVDFILFISY